MASRLKHRYFADLRPRLARDLGIDNIMEVPRLTKVVVNSGVGEAISDQNAPENAARDLGIITGQKPVITRATRSISNFSLRKGMRVGVMATLAARRCTTSLIVCFQSEYHGFAISAGFRDGRLTAAEIIRPVSLSS